MRLASARRRVHAQSDLSLPADQTAAVAFRVAAKLRIVTSPRPLSRREVAALAAAAEPFDLAEWVRSEWQHDAAVRSGRLVHSPRHHRNGGSFYATPAEIAAA